MVFCKINEEFLSKISLFATKEDNILRNLHFKNRINFRDFINKPDEVILKIKSYLSGEKVDFSDIKIELEDYTDFEREVLNKVREISYGKTLSYSDLANSLGKPNSTRAVAKVLEKNRYPLIIPCHRVIGKNDIGGYKYGIKIKKKLLELESKNF